MAGWVGKGDLLLLFNAMIVVNHDGHRTGSGS